MWNHRIITSWGLELEQIDMQFIQEKESLSKPEVMVGQQTQKEKNVVYINERK